MRRWFKRVGIGLVILGVLSCVMWLALRLHGRLTLTREIVKWRDMGIPLVVEESTEAEAAATPCPRLVKAMTLYDKVPEHYRDIIDDYLSDDIDALAQGVEAFADVRVLMHEITAESAGPWGGEVSVSISDFDPLIDRLGSARRACRLFASEATVYAEQDDWAAASDSIEAGLVVGRRVNEHHALIAMLTTVAIDHAMIGRIEAIYAEGGWPNESAMDALREIDYRADIPSMLEGEALLYLQAPEVSSKSPLILYDTAYALGQYRRVIEAIKTDQTPLRELVYELDPPWWAYLYKVSAVAFDQSTKVLTKAQARVELTKTAIRLRQYKNEHGAYPAGLDELTDLPIDPWTGEAFEYRRDGEGFVLTSSGDYDGDPNDWHWEK